MTKLYQGGTNQENTNPQNKVKYPQNYIQTTSCGHCFEMNNTAEGERVRIINANGNFFDMDQKNNTNFKSLNDTIVLSDHNLVLKIGTDPETDRMSIHVIGDVNLYVEGDMHTEVEGDRFDMVNGNWQQECKGVYSLIADENMHIESKNQMKLHSNSYENKTTFLYNDLTEGGSVKEDVKGNYEIKIQKEAATFSVKSDGNIRTNAKRDRLEYVEGNKITDVVGKFTTQVKGDGFGMNGGPFDGMLASTGGNSYDINVTGNYRLSTTGNTLVAAAGDVDIDGSSIYLN